VWLSFAEKEFEPEFEIAVRGCLKSPDSRQILSGMCSLQLPESWHEACTTFCELGIGRTFQTSSQKESTRADLAVGLGVATGRRISELLGAPTISRGSLIDAANYMSCLGTAS